MAKSKRSVKRRYKQKERKRREQKYKVDNNKTYMKTDGHSRVCVFSSDHKFIRYATEEEPTRGNNKAN